MQSFEYLTQSRLKKKKLQKDLARNLRISPQFIGRIEKGEVGIPSVYIEPWCKYLGISKNKLIDLMAEDYKAKIKRAVS